MGAVPDIKGNFAQIYGRSDFWEGYVANKGVTRGAYLNLMPYLPTTKADMHFWSYPGSQIHPPCYEGVQWFVLRKAHEAMQSEIQRLVKQFNVNARPQQA